MIRKEEMDKLLKLFDAGIIGFDDYNTEGPTKRIYGIESFNLDFSKGIISPIPNPENIFHNIDTDLGNIIEVLDKVNSIQNLKIGKNSIQYYWKLNFYNVVVNIENILIDSDDLTNAGLPKDYLKSIEEINTYLLSEFEKIESFIKDPSVSTTINSSINFNNFETLLWYFNNYKDNYSDLVTGSIKVSFKYVIDIFSKKV